jgi:hypothetical protein
MPKLSRPKVSLPTRPASSVPRSQAERLWLIGGGLVGLLVALIAFFLFISPQRSETSDINGQVDQTQQDNAILQARLDALREQSKNMALFERQLSTAKLALPTTAGMSDFLRSLQELGNSTLTDVTQLTVGQPLNVTTVIAATPTQVPGANATASPATASAGTTPTIATGPQVYALPITAQVSGAPGALNKFLDQLQAVQPRAVLITQIGETTGAAAGSGVQSATGATSLQLTMDAFVAPTNPTEQASLSAASH